MKVSCKDEMNKIYQVPGHVAGIQKMTDAAMCNIIDINKHQLQSSFTWTVVDKIEDFFFL